LRRHETQSPRSHRQRRRPGASRTAGTRRARAPSNARFAESYTRDQLAAEGITFKAADELTDAEQAYTNARSGCVIAHAGHPLTTGEQAECYANEYIAAHLANPERDHQGMTYAELGAVQFGLQTQVAEAEAAGDPGLQALQDELAAVTAARDTVFKGTMLRGSLLTTYGFGVLGERAAQAATIFFVAGGLLTLLSIAGFVHALLTPKTRAFAPIEPENAVPATKPFAQV
jgi:hypothetical protein